MAIVIPSKALVLAIPSRVWHSCLRLSNGLIHGSNLACSSLAILDQRFHEKEDEQKERGQRVAHFVLLLRVHYLQYCHGGGQLHARLLHNRRTRILHPTHRHKSNLEDNQVSP